MKDLAWELKMDQVLVWKTDLELALRMGPVLVLMTEVV